MEVDTSNASNGLHFFMGVPNAGGNLTHRSNMEISPAYSHLQGKDVSNTSPMTSPAIMRRSADLANNLNNSMMDPITREQRFQQQILHLKEQQRLQQEILLQQFQQQQQQLAEQHEKQLQQHIKEYWEQQKKLEEDARIERERREKEKLVALKNKDRQSHSAIASSEVKQRLQKFVLDKQQREAAANSSTISPPNHRNWHLLLGKYDDDEYGKLRKTASEPNLKLRSIKQKIGRNSPLLRHKERAPVPTKRRPPLTIDTENSTPDSGPNSPPNGTTPLQSRCSSGSTTIQEEQSGSQYGPLSQGSIGDLTLYSSPSLPNISLGRPVPNSSGDGESKVVMSEAQLRACAARLGMSLTGHTLYGILPFYPSLPVIDGEFTPPTSPAYIHQQMENLERQSGRTGSIITGLYPGGHITDAQVAQARLNRIGHRPLGRTQSAPLPLAHPMLQPQGILVTPQQQERYLQDKQLFEQQQQHNLLKQTMIPVVSEHDEHELVLEMPRRMSAYPKHIRQTVLTRTGSKNQVENVEEETEAAVALAMRDQEVIDLTDKKNDDSELARQQRERGAFLQQQRDLMMRHTLTISEEPLCENSKDNKPEVEGSAFTPRHHTVRPLSRALSSPLVTISPSGSPQETTLSGKPSFTTAELASSHFSLAPGLVFDSLMLKHQCGCGDNSTHPEHSGRLQSIWARLQETGLAARCERVKSRKATLEEIQTCHSEAHTLLFGTSPLNRQKFDMNKLADLPIKSFVMLPCGGVGVDSDTTWNDAHTAAAAKMAAGCVIELAFKAATGEIKNGFAVVRPPGHHAEHHQAMGFCFFNSVAIAAKLLRQRLRLEKILIVDWDVHHGNGTQQLFYADPHVLYISIHRHDDGNFFPGTGASEEVGVDDGVGFNVNIAWSGCLNPPMGDAEYMAAFRTIVIPIAKDFNPDIILVSAGFDAAAGHPSPLGGYKVSSSCFGHMARQLLPLANGRVVLALEGGYDLPAICDASQECVKALLGDDIAPLREEERIRKPCQPAIETLQKTIAIQAPHWPCIKRWAQTVSYSLVEAQQKEKEEVETVTALASLSMVHTNQSAIECGFTNLPPQPPNGATAVVVGNHPPTTVAVAVESVEAQRSPDRGHPVESEEPMEEDIDAK